MVELKPQEKKNGDIADAVFLFLRSETIGKQTKPPANIKMGINNSTAKQRSIKYRYGIQKP